jgi:hypothetical protein
MTYNVLRVVQWALAAEHGKAKIEQEFSSYYLVDELVSSQKPCFGRSGDIGAEGRWRGRTRGIESGK